MRITIAKDPLSNRHEVMTEHKAEELFWSGKSYDKTELYKDNWDSLKYINQFWSEMPHASQDEVFELYKQAWDIFQSAQSVDMMMKQLYPVVQRLIDGYHNLEEIEAWITKRTDIIVPVDINEKIEYEAGSNVVPDKTYLRRDYLQLISLSIACQAMIPIWCEFIRCVGAVVGPDFKEWQAYKLLSRSHMWRSPAMMKLIAYITSYIMSSAGEAGEAEAIMKGVCKEDLPRFNTSSILIRRVAIGDISGHKSNQYFINYIYSYIKQRQSNPKGLGRGGASSRIESKRDPSGERGDVDELSTLEGYKNQPKVCIGDAETMRYFADNPKKIAAVLDTTIPNDKIMQCLEAAMALERLPIHRAQKVLVQWFGKAAIPPRGIEELSKMELLSLMAVCQAALWHWGFKHIAVLLTAIPDEETQEDVSVMVNSYELSVKNREILDKLFPFTKGGLRGRSKKLQNVGVDCIETLTATLHEREWVAYAPLSLKNEHTPPILNTVAIDPYIRDMLTEAFVHSLNMRAKIKRRA